MTMIPNILDVGSDVLYFHLPDGLMDQLNNAVLKGRKSPAIAHWVRKKILAAKVVFSTADGVRRPARKRHVSAMLLHDGTLVIGVNRRYEHFPLIQCAENLAVVIAVGMGYAHKIVMGFTYSDHYEGKEAPCSCHICISAMLQHKWSGLRRIWSAGMTDKNVLKWVRLDPRGEFASQTFAGDGPSNGTNAVPGYTLVHNRVVREHFETIMERRALPPKVLDVAMKVAAHNIQNSEYPLPANGGVIPQVAFALSRTGNVAVGTTFKSGNPPQSVSAVNAAIGTAVTAGEREIGAVIAVSGEEAPNPWHADDLERLTEHIPAPFGRSNVPLFHTWLKSEQRPNVVTLGDVLPAYEDVAREMRPW